MAIVVKLETLMMRYGIPLDELAELVGITNVNLSRIKTGKIVAARFNTVDALIKAIRHDYGIEDCDVQDILGYAEDDELDDLEKGAYVSVPKDLHHMSNPASDAVRRRLSEGHSGKHPERNT